jgi:uncharacterized protein (TIGR02001 family)
MIPTLRACAAAVVLALPALAGAQSAAKPEPEFTFTGNAGVFSDYRFRGMTQTNYGPAFQGGFDFAHKSGFYLGNWNSNVEQLLYNGASLEMDFYGGYKTSFGDFGVDVGALYYFYPKTGALGTAKIDNTEIYVGGSYGQVLPRDQRFLRCPGHQELLLPGRHRVVRGQQGPQPGRPCGLSEGQGSGVDRHQRQHRLSGRRHL